MHCFFLPNTLVKRLGAAFFLVQTCSSFAADLATDLTMDLATDLARSLSARFARGFAQATLAPQLALRALAHA